MSAEALQEVAEPMAAGNLGTRPAAAGVAVAA